jgi:sarcosine oxidase
VLFCQKITRDLVAFLTSHGANLRPNTAVSAVDARAGRVITATGEAIEADRIVVTAGAWVLKLFPELAVSLTTYRTAVAYLEPPADLRPAWEAAPRILMWAAARTAMSSRRSWHRAEGRRGVHKRRAGRTRIAQPSPARETPCASCSPRRLPDLRIPRREGRTCAYTFTADETFFAAERGRALIVSACSGHGYKFGCRRRAAARPSGGIGRFRILPRWLRAELPVPDAA